MIPAAVLEAIKVSNIDDLNEAVLKHPGRTIELTDTIDITDRQCVDGRSRDWSTYRPVRKPLARAIAATITTAKDVMWNDFLNKGISHMNNALAEAEALNQDAGLIERLKAVHDDPTTSELDKDQARAHIEALGGEV